MLKTTVLLLLCALTSAAPTSGAELATEADHKRKLGQGVLCKARKSRKFKADIKADPKYFSWKNYFDADVTAYLVAEGETGYRPAQVQWEVKIKMGNGFTIDQELECDGTICPEGETKPFTDLPCDAYNWHIHAKPVGEKNECGKEFTGGHIDPNLACGGASEYKKTTCTALDFPDSYGTRCTGGNADGTSEQQKCEYGDLSGKMGKIPTDKGKTYYIDNFLQPFSKYEATSIVFHCCVSAEGYKTNCAERVACGNWID